MKQLNFNISDYLLNKTEKRLHIWQNEKILTRLWQKDPTIWKSNPQDDAELSNRLGWLDITDEMLSKIASIQDFVTLVRDKFEHVLLLGMGGSSLAPELFSNIFSHKKGFPSLSIMDSTYPEAVQNILKSLNLNKTLFVVASKSGGTAETMSFFKTCFAEIKKINDDPGSQFIAFTDPGSGLEKTAKELNFLRIFSTPPEVGGRYSVFTYFGMVPAALLGIKISELLNQATTIKKECLPGTDIFQSDTLRLAAVVGEAASDQKDKLTFLISDELKPFGDWLEQLIAESTGKEGKGILPVIAENPDFISPENEDRFFIYLKLQNGSDQSYDKLVQNLKNDNKDVVQINLTNVYDLGAEFYRWEMITALSSTVLAVNPFDQPDVQLAKSMAKESLASYAEKGRLPHKEALFENENFAVYSNTNKHTISDFLKDIKPGDYIAVLSFIAPQKEHRDLLDEFRNKLTKRYKTAVTTGFGPRFLHSTGQLHKGGKNNGYFIQITDEIHHDLPVAGADYSFGVLVTAQAQGDCNALVNRNRKIIRFHLKHDTAQNLHKLLSEI